MCHRCTVRRKVKSLVTTVLPALPTVHLKCEPFYFKISSPLNVNVHATRMLFVVRVVKGALLGTGCKKAKVS